MPHRPITIPRTTSQEFQSPNTAIPERLLGLLPFEVKATEECLIATPRSGTQFDLGVLVRFLARRAQARPFPRKAVAASLRERQKQIGIELDGDEREAVTDLAIELLRSVRTGGSLDDEWISVAEAARALRTSVEAVRAMLDSEAGRHQLGWPIQIDDYEWRIPLAALRAETRAAFLATTPRRDPTTGASLGPDSPEDDDG